MNSNRRILAQDYLDKAYKAHLNGEIDSAINDYKISIDLYPTPQAHTFLGWAFSLRGRYEEAIEQCKIAIDLDPDYGNPYNDIGSYLISLDKIDEGIDWLYRAIDAPNYRTRHFPYYNLGRIYERKGEWIRALNYYNISVEIEPEYNLAQEAMVRVTTLLN